MMTSEMKLPLNMGLMDRIIRAALGGMMVCSGNQKNNSLCRGVGMAFIAYALTGWDPLLSLFKTNTLPNNDKSIFKKMMGEKGIQALKEPVKDFNRMKEEVQSSILEASTN